MAMAAVWVTVVAVAAGQFAPAAQAHSAGGPLTLHLSATDRQIVAVWTAPADDLITLAVHLRVFDGPLTYVYQDGVLVPEESDSAITDILAASPEFATYLLERVRVSAGDDPSACAGSVDSTTNLATAGVRLSFACPARVTTAEVSVSTLFDLDPTYRILATDVAGASYIYTSAAAVHTWSFPDDAVPSLSPAASPFVVPGGSDGDGVGAGVGAGGASVSRGGSDGDGVGAGVGDRADADVRGIGVEAARPGSGLPFLIAGIAVGLLALCLAVAGNVRRQRRQPSR
jgi:hypothetical protein